DSTLRENLRLANPDADDPRLTAGLREAQLGAWFDALPAGLDTRLGAHGTPVSGGERQRIGVARALLADRPILLLDEPTAHLDHTTAAALTAELLAHITGRAAVIVTHRSADLPDLPVIALPAPVRHGHAHVAAVTSRSNRGTARAGSGNARISARTRSAAWR
ncbi:MAG TPA: ATP-binding cassette domain-containing protein, partial [Pseudonocardiaceae bacterium]